MNVLDRTRHESGKHYVAYQEKVTERHLLPLFRRLNVPLDRPILDVGCGRGGCVLALKSHLDAPIHGIDIKKENIEVARQCAKEADLDVTFEVVNIDKDALPQAQYGLMLLRDVIEHIPNLHTALSRLRPMLDEGGFLYVTFPPWWGPYAGHQHNAGSVARYMPYFHAISPTLFLNLLHRWEPDRKDWLADEVQICTNRLTRKKFEETAKTTGWNIYYRQTYFLRPAFLRMGLPTIANGFIGRLPLIGECLSTACEYLLTPNNDVH